MSSDVERGLQLRSPNDSPDESSSLLPQTSRSAIDTRSERFQTGNFIAFGSTLSLAFAGTSLAYIQRKYPTWHTFFVVTLNTWGISLASLIVLRRSRIRRLPVAVTLCGLCAGVLERVGFEFEDITLLAPLVSTVFVLVCLLCPAEDLIALTQLWFGGDWAQRVEQYLQTA